MQVRDRVRELRRARAGDLRPHPMNWRTHPELQQNALRGVLAEIGFAGALLARELADGTLQLIDGHLRAELLPDALVPVLVLDVDEREAHELLATLDPISALAEASSTSLAELLATVTTENESIREMLRSLATSEELPAARACRLWRWAVASGARAPRGTSSARRDRIARTYGWPASS